jgi:hypothetical protein
MGIKVICDGSKLGIKLKDEIESMGNELDLSNQYTIRWGNWLDGYEKGITLNTPDSIKNSQDKENVLLMLRRHHISCPSRIKPGKKTDFPILGRKYEHEGGTDIRIIDSIDEYKKSNCDYFVQLLNIEKEYKIHVMDLNVFYAEEKYSESNDVIDDFDIRTRAYGWKLRRISIKELNKIEKDNILLLAQKAVYGLGLDFGVVNIGLSPEGKAYVLDVDAYCYTMDYKCRKAYVRQFGNTIKKYEDLKENIKEITIGADPECIIKDKISGEMIFASEFLGNEGLIGLDDRSIEAGKRCFPLMELRPKYSTCPIDVVSSIKTILNDASKKINYSNIGIYAGSMPSLNYWSGGHIHFGIKPNAKLIRALDNYLALPVLMIEKTNTARKRMVKYGTLGNYRLKSHGGFEYCTLSSWLVSPNIALGVLCLAKVIVQEYLNLQACYLNTYSDVRSYYLVNKNYFKDRIVDIVSAIEKTKTYKIYEEQLEPMLDKIVENAEWKENRDIKEAWNLQNTDRIYKISERCFIPMKRRKELLIRLEDNIEFMVGGKKISAKVYPKDDQTSDKMGYVSFSEDVCSKIPCNTNDTLEIWKDHNNVLRVGPILGILSYKEENKIGPFGGQSYYFRRLIKLSKDKGMIVFVFTLSGIDWNEKKIDGYTYDFEKNIWYMATFPLPDVIYDRGDYICKENFGSLANEYKMGLIENDIKSINSLECINLTNDKWETCQLLESNEVTSSYQIETCEYLDDEEFNKFLTKYNHVFLKPKHGSRSKGIFSIEKLNCELYEVVFKEESKEIVKYQMDYDSTISLLNNRMEKDGYSKKDYIIQKAIELVKYMDKHFEIRVVMQKNSSGFWHRTCMIARVTGKDEKFIDVQSEKDARSSYVLRECFGDNYEVIRNKIREASKAVASLFDDRGIIAGEISIDFGLDEEFNLYIIELNSKPDNLLSTIGAFKLRNLAVNRVLEYSKYLVINLN